MTRLPPRPSSEEGVPEEGVPEEGVPTAPDDGIVRRLVIAGALFVLSLLSQYATGAYTAAPTTGADDPAHFLSGLMVRDYLADALGRPPVAFAGTYYAHYPKLGIGNWPPLYYGLQGVWMLLLPARPTSVLVLLAVLAAGTAWLVYRMLRPAVGTAFAVFGGAVFLAFPIVQTYSAVVMAEVPLTFFCTLAVVFWTRFMDTRRTREVLWFTGCAALAVLTKPSGLLLGLMVPLALLIGQRWDLLRVRALWWMAGFVALPVTVWIWFYLPVIRQGWEFPDRLVGDLRGATYYYLQGLGRYTGEGGVIAAAVGVWTRLVGRSRRAAVSSALWTSAAAIVVATLLFHVLSPAGLDNRHILPAYPFVAMFIAAGSYALAGLVRSVLPRPALAAGLVMVAIVTMLAWPRSPLPRLRVDGFDVAARLVTPPPTTERPVSVLIGSNAEGEGAFIVAMAVRDRMRPHHTVWRGSKLLTTSTWSGREYALRTESDSGVIQLLERAGIDWIVLDLRLLKLPHLQLLRRVAVAHPDRFRFRYHLSLRRGKRFVINGLAVIEIRRPDGSAPRPTLRQVPGPEGIVSVTPEPAVGAPRDP